VGYFPGTFPDFFKTFPGNFFFRIVQATGRMVKPVWNESDWDLIEMMQRAGNW
jgi:hypothetical protein